MENAYDRYRQQSKGRAGASSEGGTAWLNWLITAALVFSACSLAAR